MSARRPPEMTESIAEALRAGLALIAVVLLARAHVGALTNGPSVWVGLPVCMLAWGAAVGVARWSRHSGGSRLSVWRDCMAPALVTLLIAGSGGSGSLAMGIGLVTIGAVAVGLAATCCRTDLWERSGAAMEAMATTTNRDDSPKSGPEPKLVREGEVSAVNMMAGTETRPLSAISSKSLLGRDAGVDLECESRSSDFGEIADIQAATASPVRSQLAGDAPAEPQRGEGVVSDSQPNKSFALPVTADAGLLPSECHLSNTPDSEVNESIPAESWTRTESDGEVSIEAVVLARFIEGSKLAVVHLPFVPPLPAVPQIECEPLDSGCEVTIKADAAYRHGARLSVTRPSAGPAESVPIGVVVYTSAEEPVES